MLVDPPRRADNLVLGVVTVGGASGLSRRSIEPYGENHTCNLNILIQQGEGKTLEFKESLSSSFARENVALLIPLETGFFSVCAMTVL